MKHRPPSIRSVATAEDGIAIVWEDGRTEQINRFWLRDNCPTAGDRKSAIRSFSLKDMPDDLAVGEISLLESGELQVTWRPDGHVSRFDPAWLSASLPGRRGKSETAMWDCSLQGNLKWSEWRELTPDSSAHLDLLEHLAARGFALIRNVPEPETATEALLNLAGFVQENDFGRIFNIVSEPDVWELSQSDQALDVHTDDPYRHTPPGVSLLHCVDSSPEGGGVSLLTDGFAAAEKFRRDDPNGFRLLSGIPAPFIRYREDPVPQGDDVHLFTEAPIISLDARGGLSGIRFHERSMAPLDLPPEVMTDYYPALISFTRLTNSAAFRIEHLLRPGEAIMFDNQRVLHGRTAFDGSAGRRHLRLTQTSRDQFQSKLRLLRSRHHRAGAVDRLPQGAGF